MRRRVKTLVALTVTCLGGCAYPDIAPQTNASSATRFGKHRPVCSAAAEAANFQDRSKPRLNSLDRFSGFLTTPFKHLFTSFDWPSGWRDTGCDAWGTGSPVCPAQHSTDGLYTIDIAIRDAWVNGEKVPDGRFIRLEVLPGTQAHKELAGRRPQPTDLIEFRGPLIWDRDRKDGFPDGHMEIHPRDPIKFLGTQSPPVTCRREKGSTRP